MKRLPVDKPLLISIIVLVVGGLFIFSSASLGLLARDGASYGSVTFSQTFFGLCLGTIAAYITSRINYRKWRTWSLPLFVGSCIATALVFVPHIGFSHGGAHRWIEIGSFSFQPSEFLKISFIFYLAAWLSSARANIASFKRGTLPFIVLATIAGALLLAQPDTDTYAVIFFTGITMLLAAGGSWKHVFIIFIIALIGFAGIVYERPYVRERVMTFINPASDALGSSYQIQQSLIAIGSGQVFGRGFGRSIQKFNFLPEPIGDSIFAVMAEEFGFVGGVTLIALYIFFAFRGLKVAIRAPDTFGGLVALGIVILILSQSFVNMAAMLGILPLSGIPLLFVSHGGTALFMALAEVGVLLSISRGAAARENN